MDINWTTQDDNDDCLNCGWHGGAHSEDCKHNPNGEVDA